MAKIVYNACHGGFGLSSAAMARYAEITGVDSSAVGDRELSRTDPALIRVVDELGRGASAAYADLRIAEIPDGSKYRIDEYDGMEAVMTPDDYEWQTA